jgi:hypothetical protein
MIPPRTMRSLFECPPLRLTLFEWLMNMNA